MVRGTGDEFQGRDDRMGNMRLKGSYSLNHGTNLSKNICWDSQRWLRRFHRTMQRRWLDVPWNSGRKLCDLVICRCAGECGNDQQIGILSDPLEWTRRFSSEVRRGMWKSKITDSYKRWYSGKCAKTWELLIPKRNWRRGCRTWEKMSKMHSRLEWRICKCDYWLPALSRNIRMELN